MPAVQEQTRGQKRWIIPIIAGVIIVAALAIAITTRFKQSSVTLAQGYVASPSETAVLYDEDVVIGGGVII